MKTLLHRPFGQAFFWIVLCLQAFSNIVAGAPAGVALSNPIVTMGDLWLMDTDPTHDSVSFNVRLTLNRNQPGQLPRDIPIELRIRLMESTVETNVIAPVVGLLVHTEVVTVPAVAVNWPVDFDLEIVPNKILSQDHTYRLSVTVRHNDDPPAGEFAQSTPSISAGPYRFIHFSGNLSFGKIDTAMQSFSAAPFEIPAPNGWRLRIAEGLLSNGSTYANQVPSTTVVDTSRDNLTGNAEVLFGSVLVQPSNPVFTTNGWTGELGPVLLDTSGLEAQYFRLNLPEGSGWRLDDMEESTTAVLNPVFSSGDVALPLNEDLRPTKSISGTFGVPHEFVDERFPVGLIGTQWTWDFVTLRLTNPSARFLRQHHYAQWLSVKGELPDDNGGYLGQLAAQANSDLVIHPGFRGGFDVDLILANGVFSPHFPHGFVAHTGGAIRLATSSVDRVASSLPIATTTVIVRYGCRPPEEPHGLPEPATREYVQVGPQPLGFTEQGGLWVAGPPAADWDPLDSFHISRRAAAGLDGSSGEPVHETDDYIGQDVSIYVPGISVPAADGFDRADDTNSTVDEIGEHPESFNPARWLYTGLRGEDDFSLEHPGTPEYMDGMADYPGVNFRHFEGLSGISRVGGSEMGPYQLEQCQKINARASGTTGRWVADDTTLPPLVQIGMPEPFDFVFDQWAFLLVQNDPQFEHSAVSGNVTLPYPADISLDFDSLEFTCCGNLDKLELADGASVQNLAYWQQARIDIQSARFVSAEECSMEDSCLELHVLARANGLPEDVAGILGFRGNGHMTTHLDAPLEASALYVPNSSRLAGAYYVESVRHSHYNEPGASPQVDNGFISLAALLQVPFFQAMESHTHLTGTELAPEIDPNLLPGMQGGWEANGETHFSSAQFDAGHRGFPPALDSPEEYLGNFSETYLPRAERTWFGGIPFNFPVYYDPPTGYFHSLEKKSIDVIIAQAEGEVPYLNHEKAAIEFGVTIGLNLNNLLSDTLSFVTGEITEGFADLAIGGALQNVGEGLDELDRLLSLQVRDALGAASLPTLDNGIIADAASALKSGAGILGALDQLQFDASLRNALAAANAQFVVGRLGPIASGLEGMRNFLEGGNNGQLGQFMERAMDYLNLPEGLDVLDVSELIELSGVDTGPLRERIEVLRERMAELRDLVQNIVGLDVELEGLFNAANLDFGNLQGAVSGELQDYFNTVAANVNAYTQEEIENRIRTEIESRLWSMPVMSQMQTVLRSRFYQVDHMARQVLASALDQLNRAITDLVAEHVDLDGAVGDLLGIGGYVQAASLKGVGVISGDDLHYLSLTGHTEIQTEPIPFELNPFFEYEQLHSDGGTACDPAQTPFKFNRITMGATVAPARMPLGEVSVTLSTQFSFTEDARLIGFMGGFEVLAEGISMQPVNFDRMNVLLHIGGNDPSFDDFQFYIAGEAQATIFKSASPVQQPWSNFKLHGGLFAGRTCSEDPYISWAPETVKNGLPDLPFTGVIAAVDGKFPFYDLGCFLRLKAGAQVGAWGAVHHEPGEPGLGFNAGAFMGGSVSGDFLCLIHGKGSIELAAGVGGGGSFLSGDINAELKLGKCPFCIGFDAHYGVTISSEGAVNTN